ncbi:MAG: hypothetical protein WA364_27390 [Candidatus Nitrosopolaris sp.]
MVLIHTSRDVKATLDSVWDVISDTDREPEFWHGTKSIKNISKIGNTIEREVVIAFGNSKCREIVKLDDKKSVNIDIIQGPIRGKKTIALKTINNHGNEHGNENRRGMGYQDKWPLYWNDKKAYLKGN